MIKFILALMTGASMAIAASSASAAVITFDEFAPANTNGVIPSNRYASLGVTIQATDDGSTFGGIANGDPGNWDLNGTNGAIFSGFNGPSYSMSFLFASDITTFSLDAARAAGSSDGTITLYGYLNGSLTSSNSVVLGAINSWSTVGLMGLFDQVTVTGTGTGFHPFGIDNVNFSSGPVAGPVPEPGTWAMMLLGFGGVGMTMRRSRRRNSAMMQIA